MYLSKVKRTESSVNIGKSLHITHKTLWGYMVK